MQVLPPPHPASLPVEELMRRCAVSGKSRKGGPGGQHRNKVETGVEVTHGPTGLTGWASERRERVENLRVAQFRLRVSLAVGVRTERDLVAGPSEVWRSRVTPTRQTPQARLGSPAGSGLEGGASGGVIRCNEKHTDFPTLLAEALDVLWMKRWDPKPAAVLLGVSMSQLVRFVGKEPAALDALNAGRGGRGLRPLRV